jgi:mannose-1-phosphate guanylyltransferase
VLVDSSDNLVINSAGDGRLLAAVGLRDMVVVQTDQITVVCPMSEAERIKELVGEVAERMGPSYT